MKSNSSTSPTNKTISFNFLNGVVVLLSEVRVDGMVVLPPPLKR